MTRLVSIGLLALAISAPACGGDASPAGDVAPDVAEPIDAAEDVDMTPDVPETSDVPGPADATADTDGPFTLTCRTGADCRTPCAAGTCESGRCVFPATASERIGCIVAATADGAAEAPAEEPLFRCVAPGTLATDGCRVCEPREVLEGWTNVLFSEDFDTGGGQFQIERTVFSTATWSIDTFRSASGDASLYFGDPSLRSYGVGVRAAADAVSRPLAGVDDATPYVLTFNLFADTEEKVGFDALTVLLRMPDATELALWSSDELGGTTLDAFARVRIEVPAISPGSRLVFRADSVDDIINNFEGFYLDDLRLVRSCCDGESACDDADSCTTDACVGGACVHETDAACCASAHDCQDGDHCTRDLCLLATGVCDHTDIDGCCRTASDCDDSDACTSDSCRDDGVCVNTPTCCEVDRDCEDGDLCTLGTCDAGTCRYTNSCCTDRSECDDADRCTSDSCIEGVCENTFNFDVGCCLPDVLTERFDTSSATTWTLSPATNNIGWRLLNSATAPSGARILFYGHPTLLFYESGGRNSGIATGPARRLPVGVQSYLSFSIRLDIEPEPSRDLFSVELVVGERTVTVATKANLVYGAWQDLQYDLSWAAGQEVQVRFRFDTVDGVQNTGRGISIDDVQIHSDCQPRVCAEAGDCPSRLDCLIPECTDGACVYRGACE